MDIITLLAIGFFVFLPILIIVLVGKELIEEYKKDAKKTKKYIIDSVKSAFMGIFISALGLGVLLFILLSDKLG